MSEKAKKTYYNTSKYNAKKIISFCEIKECSNKAEHTHHILERRDADENGLVGHVRLNHQANLVGLCESCHNKVHKGKIDIRGYVQTSQGLLLDYTIYND
jgi:5-methylcytosine-specific restriction endonuclease McrA